jgi:putative mRNA 3-end processing factor
MALLSLEHAGLYCAQADAHIDPWKPVKLALITHGHADHARPGSDTYVCHKDSLPVLKLRLGSNINVMGLDYGESWTVRGVKISLHPAGHIPGSAQVKLDNSTEVWVVSGDYKTTSDGISTPFEPQKCNHFISECTFGLPAFRFPNAETVWQEIYKWHLSLRESGKHAIVLAYSLGKAQRVADAMNKLGVEVYAHPSILQMQQTLNPVLANPVELLPVPPSRKQLPPGSFILAPPAVFQSTWEERLGPSESASASGWMALRGQRRRRGFDRGFIISDHADWDGLNWAVKACNADKIWLTHGYTDVFSRWLNECGYNAEPLNTLFGGDTED